MKKTSWLTYVNLSDSYERKARFFPAVISLLALIPIPFVLEFPVSDWLTTLLSGVGISAILSVGLSHVASAFGNRIQKQLWPRWPYDAPTNAWLNPKNTIRSTQQKALWYSTIHRLTDLDIASAIAGAEEGDIEATINDAIAQLRNLLWSSEGAARLRIHNTDYGFARNLTGLRPVWLGFSAISTLFCWLWFFRLDGTITWPIISTLVIIIAVILAFGVFPTYVKRKADHYAETLFAAVTELDRKNRH